METVQPGNSPSSRRDMHRSHASPVSHIADLRYIAQMGNCRGRCKAKRLFHHRQRNYQGPRHLFLLPFCKLSVRSWCWSGTPRRLCSTGQLALPCFGQRPTTPSPSETPITAAFSADICHPSDSQAPKQVPDPSWHYIHSQDSSLTALASLSRS